MRFAFIMPAIFTCVLIQSGCNDPNPHTGPQSQDSTWWACKDFYSDDPVHFKVLYPNGGEVLRIGDTVLLKFCSEDTLDYEIGMATKEISMNSGADWCIMDTWTDGQRVYWSVPDSVFSPALNGYVSVLSDSCKVKIRVYIGGLGLPEDFDVSDDIFRILPGNVGTGN